MTTSSRYDTGAHEPVQNDTQIAVQIAVETIIDQPQAFDIDQIEAVRRAAVKHGVPEFYIEMLPERSN